MNFLDFFRKKDKEKSEAGDSSVAAFPILGGTSSNDHSNTPKGGADSGTENATSTDSSTGGDAGGGGGDGGGGSS